MKMNKGQWAVVGIICAILGVNMSFVFVPIPTSRLWMINSVLLLGGSGLYYVLRNEDM